MPNARFYSSIAAVTNLQVTANPSDVSFQVASSSGWPGSFPFIVSLDYGAANEELVLVTSGGPNIFQATRAYDGTSSSTHNAGAVVRHVSSAIDFTDSRTHEASTTGVHGVSGTFVDTTSTQTLTNKTLTSPTINNPTIGGTASGGTYTGATLTSPVINTPTINSPAISGGSITGSISGTPSYTGAATFSSQINANGGVLVTNSPAGTFALGAAVTGDTNSRFRITNDGIMSWGPGNATQDVTLQRSGAAFLSVGGSLTTSGSVTATGNLLGNDLSLTTTTWTSFTPVYSGTGLPSFNTNVGWYKKVGKMVTFEIYTVFGATGTGSAGLQVNFPTTPFRDGNGANTTRQGIMGFISGSVSGVVDGICIMPCFASDTGTTGATLRRYDYIPIQMNDLNNTTVITIQGTYREA